MDLIVCVYMYSVITDPVNSETENQPPSNSLLIYSFQILTFLVFSVFIIYINNLTNTPLKFFFFQFLGHKCSFIERSEK